MADTGIGAGNADAEVGAEDSNVKEGEEAGKVVTVPLTQGQVAIIDAADAERVLAHKWHALLIHGRYRAMRIYWDGKRPKRQCRHEYMHRVIMNAPPGRQVDHVNGDPLDNRKANLRLATNAENCANKGKLRTNTSGFKGVNWHKQRNKWQAGIKCRGRLHYLGLYGTAEEAARAYDIAARQLFGEFAKTNF